MPAEFDITVRLALYRGFVRMSSLPTAETREGD
jgi:hypothetical protein